MFKLFSDYTREFKHVVWPTREETKKYFWVVLTVLIAFGVYLFVVNHVFSNVVIFLKEMLNDSI